MLKVTCQVVLLSFALPSYSSTHRPSLPPSLPLSLSLSPLQLAGPDRTKALALANSILRRVDLFCEVRSTEGRQTGDEGLVGSISGATTELPSKCMPLYLVSFQTTACMTSFCSSSLPWQAPPLPSPTLRLVSNHVVVYRTTVYRSVSYQVAFCHVASLHGRLPVLSSSGGCCPLPPSCSACKWPPSSRSCPCLHW